MRSLLHQEIRNRRRLIVVYLVAGLWLVGCATPQPRADDSEPNGQNTVAATTPAPEGPFDVAQNWATEFSPDAAPDAVGEVVDEWQRAQVARVWASGGEYRAVIVQKNTAKETPAVLLRITRGDTSQWQVISVEPTTSTNLWSEL